MAPVAFSIQGLTKLEARCLLRPGSYQRLGVLAAAHVTAGRFHFPAAVEPRLLASLRSAEELLLLQVSDHQSLRLT